MLPKAHRLPSIEIRSVLSRGARLSVPEVQLVWRVRDLGIARFAFVTSIETSKRATVRNRVKRLMREAVHHLLPKLRPDIDAVFLARKGLIGMSEVEVERIFEALLRRASFFVV